MFKKWQKIDIFLKRVEKMNIFQHEFYIFHGQQKKSLSKRDLCGYS